jgi:hypothetical protein
MFGFTKLTPEEIAERDKKLRIQELDKLLKAETNKRLDSLKVSEKLRDELEELTGV